jgi:hypothetical protein
MTRETAAQQSHTAPTRVAYQILRLGFAVLPIVFGFAKLFDFLTDWTIFLPDFVTEVVSGSVLMRIAGVGEILIGVGVWIRPRIFAYLVAAWLAVIIVTLAIIGGFWSIALRDFGLLLGATALGQLARAKPDRSETLQ